MDYKSKREQKLQERLKTRNQSKVTPKKNDANLEKQIENTSSKQNTKVLHQFLRKPRYAKSKAREVKVEKLDNKKLGKIVDLTKQNTLSGFKGTNKDLEIFEDAKTNKFEDFQQDFSIDNPIKERISRFKRNECKKTQVKTTTPPLISEGESHPPVRESSYSIERIPPIMHEK